MAKPKVNHIYLSPGENGEKVGVDDFLLEHSVEELKALRDKPKPTPTPEAPRIEWLDEAPPRLNRLLAHIEGHAYAATLIYIKVRTTESVTSEGNLVRHDPPIENITKELFTVRDDGEVFGFGCENSIEDLSFDIELETLPFDSKLWRNTGVQRFTKGYRPNAADVFQRVSSVFDRFLDFSRSFASQSEMCELSACFSLMTWFQAVFTVLGYPWPNGDKGSGKTKWGLVWTMTSYLGEMVLASTTFPVLRDLAQYGATLLFDDAENLADPRKSDPDKRALLLAGNRKGAKIGVKEQLPDSKRYVTRYCDAYCPRGFTAINAPDEVLASRSITIPLARTANPKKGNADPVRTKSWPCNHKELLDDLWALALSLMSEAKNVWDEFDDEEEIVGREFEPWRAILTVARLFETHGVHGLEERTRNVLKAYQKEKAEQLEDDWTLKVIRALLTLTNADTMDTSDVADTSIRGIEFSSSQVANIVKNVTEDEDTQDEDKSIDRGMASRVGRKLSQLRLKYKRKSDRKRTRTWTTNPQEVIGIAQSYGLVPMNEQNKEDFEYSNPAEPSVRSGLSVRSVRTADSTENSQVEQFTLDTGSDTVNDELRL